MLGLDRKHGLTEVGAEKWEFFHRAYPTRFFWQASTGAGPLCGSFESSLSSLYWKTHHHIIPPGPTSHPPMHLFLSNLSFLDACYTTSSAPLLLVNLRVQTGLSPVVAVWSSCVRLWGWDLQNTFSWELWHLTAHSWLQAPLLRGAHTAPSLGPGGCCFKTHWFCQLFIANSAHLVFLSFY